MGGKNLTKEIENRLLNCKNLSEFSSMFLGLGIKDKMSIFTEDVSIKKGTNFYRVRRFNGIKNMEDPKEWESVPSEFAKQGRFNKQAESVLYVASNPDTLEREIKLKEGEEYCLAKYVCKNDFEVGSFLGKNNYVNTLIHKIAMAVSGAEELTGDENAMIDDYYKKIKHNDLFELSLDILAPFYIYKMLPNLYEKTNKLGKIILQKNECGIRYSSVYSQMELSGGPVIITLDGMEYGNYILTQKGYNNIEFVSAEKKTAGKIQDMKLMISEFIKTQDIS